MTAGLARARHRRDRPLPRGHDGPRRAPARRASSGSSSRWTRSRPRCARCSRPARHTASPSPRVRAAAATSTSTSRRPRPSATSPAGPPSRWMPSSPTAAATPTAWASAAGSTPCCGAPSAPGEPAWDDDLLGAGRPGWHIECTAIALQHLGHPFEVQGGGSDLVFPHHEMSAVQSTALNGDEAFARHYVHQAMVGFEGTKMSKSKGNLVLVSKLRADGVDPMAIRLVLLARHYRTDWDYTPDLLECRDGAPRPLARGALGQPGRGCRVDRRRGPGRRRGRPRHPGRAGRGRRLGRPHAGGGVGRRGGAGPGLTHRRRGARHPPLTHAPTFPPDAGTFTFAPEMIPCEREGSPAKVRQGSCAPGRRRTSQGWTARTVPSMRMVTSSPPGPCSVSVSEKVQVMMSCR